MVKHGKMISMDIEMRPSTLPIEIFERCNIL